MIHFFKSTIFGRLKEINTADRYFYFFARQNGLSLLGVLFSIIAVLIYASKESFYEFGIEFIFSSQWNPIENQYGALPFIYGTVLTSLIALLIATPPCLALALFNTELCPHQLKPVFSFVVEILAAIPSIIYGMWALFILAPFVREYLFPLSQKILPNFILFQGPSFGIGMLTASIVLAIMISPIIVSMTTEVFKAIPQNEKLAALALGATRWEMFQLAILKAGKSGIWAAMTLGLGRALGETMAVAMVIGNNPEMKASLFATGSTMASVMANEYAEALDALHLSTLNYIALLLFFISFIINLLAKVIINQVRFRG